MSYFDAALDLHKERFEDYTALIVLDDIKLRKYVMAWRPLLVKVLDEFPSDNDMASLWKCVEVDFQAIADLTGDSTPDVMACFRRCQGLQLIYPDGTIPEPVAAALRNVLLELGKQKK